MTPALRKRASWPTNTPSEERPVRDQLAKLNKDQAIELAHRAQRSRRNQENKMAKLVTTLLAGGLGAGFAGALGYWMGQAEYEYETSEDKEAIDAGDEPDPRKWFGVDKDLIVAVGVTGLGLLLMLSGKGEKMVKTGAGMLTVGLGGLAGALYSKGHASGYKSMSDDEEEDEAA